MKIAYINADADVPVFGSTGCSVHVQEMLLAMLNLGAQVHVFTTRIGNEAPPAISTLAIHPLPRLPMADLATREQAALATNRAVRQALVREMESGKFDLVYERYSLWCYAGMEFAREYNIPAVLEVNAPLIEEHTSARALINRPAAEEVAMRAFRSANVITAVSRQLATIIETHPSARGKIHVVPNAVDATRFQQAQPLLPRDGSFVVGYAGSLRGWQGLTTLIESFTDVVDDIPHARLVIAGEGPEKEHLSREIAARELNARVQLLGAVPAESMPSLLASFDIAVAPYPPLARFYLSPLKIFEYLAAGLPVVASRIGQVGESIRHRETGLLIQPGSARELTHALCELAHDPELRQRLGEAARASIKDHTWDDSLRRVLSLAGVPIPAVAA